MKPPASPHCVMVRIQFGLLSTVKVPESDIERRQADGWSVLVRDTDFPPESRVSFISNPRRFLDPPDPVGEADD